MTTRSYTEIVRDLLTGLCHHPGNMVIEETDAGMGRSGEPAVRVGVSCHDIDRPQLMGKAAQRAQTVRRLLELAAARRGETVVCYRVEDNPVRLSHYENHPKTCRNWTRNDEVRGILERLLADITDQPYHVVIRPSFDRSEIVLHLRDRDLLSVPLFKDSELTLLDGLQGFWKGWGRINGWRIYLSVKYIDE